MWNLLELSNNCTKYPKGGDRRYYCQYLKSKYKTLNELKFVKVSQ